ncbi:unnamed protein product [Haemonchus placei]|uniref:Nanos-type domain-containing protein n=1 Tax=Haemonchus placei TaxID=6290 RepID=A0A0N4W3K6_HAEPC|nr:unnamed protein product [Haemonchus placei]
MWAGSTCLARGCGKRGQSLTYDSLLGTSTDALTKTFIPMLSIAPFPNKIWSTVEDSTMTTSSEFPGLYHITDTSLMYNLLSTMTVEEEPLWFQPTDQLRSVPAKPLNRVLPNPVRAEATTIQCRSNGSPRVLKVQKSWPPMGTFRSTKPVNQTPKPNVLPKSGEKATGSGCYTGGDCAYCRSVGKPSCGHLKTSCPELFALKPCTLCGADGFDNHTLMHCPSQQKIKLEMKEDHRLRMDMRQAERTMRRIAISNGRSPAMSV